MTVSVEVSESPKSLCESGIVFDGVVASVVTGCPGFPAKYGSIHVLTWLLDDLHMTMSDCVSEASCEKVEVVVNCTTVSPDDGVT